MTYDQINNLLENSSGTELLHILKSKTLKIKHVDGYLAYLIKNNNDKILEQLPFILKHHRLYKDRPLAELWTQAVSYKDSRIPLMKEAGFVPVKDSFALLSACKNQVKNPQLNHQIILEVADLLFSQHNKKAIFSDLQRYPVTQYHKGMMLNEDIQFLDEIYQKAQPSNPYKFRYYCLMNQIKYLEAITKNKITEHEKFANTVGYGTIYMLENNPKSMEKLLQIKTSQNAYSNYVEHLIKFHELNKILESTLIEKYIEKKIKL